MRVRRCVAKAIVAGRVRLVRRASASCEGFEAPLPEVVELPFEQGAVEAAPGDDRRRSGCSVAARVKLREEVDRAAVELGPVLERGVAR